MDRRGPIRDRARRRVRAERPAALLIALVVLGAARAPAPAGEPPHRSPADVAFSPDGRTLAAADATSGEVVLIDVGAQAPRARAALRGAPACIVWTSAGDALFVSENGAGTVARIDPERGVVTGRIAVGPRPVGLALAETKGLLVVAGSVTDDLSIVDLAAGTERARVALPREPHHVAVTPDGRRAVATSLLPAGSAADPVHAAAVSIVDLERGERLADVLLPHGSTSAREVVISSDGKRAWAAHTIGRFWLPATQIERGWVNTNAISAIDIGIDGAEPRLALTVLLDDVDAGAADPWGLALADGGATLWVSLRGAHEVARVDIGALERLLRGEELERLASPSVYAGGGGEVWARLGSDRADRSRLDRELGALRAAGLIERRAVSGNGPRGIDVSPDGSIVAAALYYSGAVALIDARSGAPIASVPLGPQRPPDAARRGEVLFHDATLCFQTWMSCATCHPDGGRTDGLRWDLLNDGIGTPQRTRSLLKSHLLERTTARGARAGVAESVPKGLAFVQHAPDEEIARDLIAYLSSLEVEPGPFLIGGELSPAASRGRDLFAGKAGCERCHEGALGIDQKAHDVGTGDRPGERFYTPKLIELWRTAPFLHDGRAAALADIFRTHDPEGRHGKASDLDENELRDLVEYLRSR